MAAMMATPATAAAVMPAAAPAERPPVLLVWFWVWAASVVVLVEGVVIGVGVLESRVGVCVGRRLVASALSSFWFSLSLSSSSSSVSLLLLLLSSVGDGRLFPVTVRVMIRRTVSC
jgi:hypothetical protein